MDGINNVNSSTGRHVDNNRQERVHIKEENLNVFEEAAGMEPYGSESNGGLFSLEMFDLNRDGYILGDELQDVGAFMKNVQGKEYTPVGMSSEKVNNFINEVFELMNNSKMNGMDKAIEFVNLMSQNKVSANVLVCLEEAIKGERAGFEGSSTAKGLASWLQDNLNAGDPGSPNYELVRNWLFEVLPGQDYYPNNPNYDEAHTPEEALKILFPEYETKSPISQTQINPHTLKEFGEAKTYDGKTVYQIDNQIYDSDGTLIGLADQE